MALTSSASVRARAFIVGCPRSGTTLLQALLSTQAGITSFPESHFFPYVFSRHALAQAFRLSSKAAVRHFEDFLTEAGCEQYLSVVPRRIRLRARLIRAFLCILDAVTVDRSCTIWVEKTPEHLHYIDRIQSSIPRCKFIHIIRAAPDVVASLYAVAREHPEAWGGPRTIDECVDRWIRDVEITRRHRESPDHIVVCYRNMVEDPAATIRLVCQFLGAPFREEALRDYPSQGSRLITRGEVWKRGVIRDIAPDPRRKFHDVFDAAQHNYILDRLEPYSEALTSLCTSLS